MYPCLLLKVLAEYDLQLCACSKKRDSCVACVLVRFARGYTPRLHLRGWAGGGKFSQASFRDVQHETVRHRQGYKPSSSWDAADMSHIGGFEMEQRETEGRRGSASAPARKSKLGAEHWSHHVSLCHLGVSGCFWEITEPKPSVDMSATIAQPSEFSRGT